MKLQPAIYIIVIAALVAALLFGSANCGKKDDTNEKQLQVLQQKFDSLATVITSYKDSLKKFDIAIADLKLRDAQLTGKLEYNKTLQTQIKKEYAKTNRFANYQSNDITKYFTDSLDN